MNEHKTERRRAPRLECEIPLMLHGHGRSLRATSADLSRVGTLLRLPIAELGVAPDTSLAGIGREAIHFLGRHVRVDLHHDVLGALIQRTAAPIRVGRARPDQDHIEIGLDLGRPLSNMEVEFLGVPLPPLYHEVDVTWEPAPATSKSTGPGPRDVTVVFCAEDEDRAPPLRMASARVDAEGARADIGSVNRLPMLVDGSGAADVLTALADVYGSDPHALLFVDSKPVWSGPSRLQAVEVSTSERRVKLEVGFPQGLSGGARERLGL